MKKLTTHMMKVGFTNRLAIYIMLFLFVGLFMGFALAMYSIRSQYVGALACFTVVFTPIGTMAGIVLRGTVEKSTVENSDENGKGIKFAAAEANGFKNSPQI